METKEYRTIDKTTWPDGPWKTEPDKKQWKDPKTGLPCLIVRNALLGNLCGYVGVLPNHPLYQVGYDEYQRFENISVHGGLTYSDSCDPKTPEDKGICHIAPGEPEPWWFGFDCAHYSDLWPNNPMKFNFPGSVYRDLNYVENEIANLAQQLIKLVPEQTQTDMRVIEI